MITTTLYYTEFSEKAFSIFPKILSFFLPYILN
jgi:hypothetical protein